MVVSAVAVPVTQAVLWLAHSALGLHAVVANVIAVATGAVPAYFLSRAWVWRRRGNHSLRAEVVPFWAYNFVGLVLSSLVVGLVAARFGADVASEAAAGGAADGPVSWTVDWPVHAANIGSFGLLWVGKFVLLDRVLFVERAH